VKETKKVRERGEIERDRERTRDKEGESKKERKTFFAFRSETLRCWFNDSEANKPDSFTASKYHF
jgi:hypothetical protein